MAEDATELLSDKEATGPIESDSILDDNEAASATGFDIVRAHSSSLPANEKFQDSGDPQGASEDLSCLLPGANAAGFPGDRARELMAKASRRRVSSSRVRDRDRSSPPIMPIFRKGRTMSPPRKWSPSKSRQPPDDSQGAVKSTEQPSPESSSAALPKPNAAATTQLVVENDAQQPATQLQFEPTKAKGTKRKAKATTQPTPEHEAKQPAQVEDSRKLSKIARTKSDASINSQILHEINHRRKSSSSPQISPSHAEATRKNPKQATTKSSRSIAEPDGELASADEPDVPPTKAVRKRKRHNAAEATGSSVEEDAQQPSIDQPSPKGFKQSPDSKRDRFDTATMDVAAPVINPGMNHASSTSRVGSEDLSDEHVSEDEEARNQRHVTVTKPKRRALPDSSTMSKIAGSSKSTNGHTQTKLKFGTMAHGGNNRSMSSNSGASSTPAPSLSQAPTTSPHGRQSPVANRPTNKSSTSKNPKSTKLAKSAIASGAAAKPKSSKSTPASSKRKRVHDDVDASHQSDDAKRQKRSKASVSKKLPPMDDEDFEIVTNVLLKHREMHDLSLEEQNDLITGSLTASKELFDMICTEFPERDRYALVKSCRRRFNNQKHGSWSKEEEDDLKFLKQQNQGWIEIGSNLNRTAEDCRDRWRNFVVCGDKRTTGYWTQDEEDTLKAKVDEALQQIHAEMADTSRHIFAGPELTHEEASELIDWLEISRRMKHTRSRKQCKAKWARIAAQEASTPDNMSLVVNNGWRQRLARYLCERLTTDDRAGLLAAIEVSNAGRESKVPWATMDISGCSADLKAPMVRKQLWLTMRDTIEGHESMPLQDIVTKLQDKIFKGKYVEVRAQNSPSRLAALTSIPPGSGNKGRLLFTRIKRRAAEDGLTETPRPSSKDKMISRMMPAEFQESGDESDHDSLVAKLLKSTPSRSKGKARMIQENDTIIPTITKQKGRISAASSESIEMTDTVRQPEDSFHDHEDIDEIENVDDALLEPEVSDMSEVSESSLVSESTEASDSSGRMAESESESEYESLPSVELEK